MNMPYKLGKWDLSHLLKKGDKKEILAKVNTVEKKVNFVASYKTKLKTLKPIEFKKLIKTMEKIDHDMGVVSVYLSLRFYANTNDQEAAALMSQLDLKSAEFSNKLLFFSLWFKKLPTNKANKYIAAAKEYDYYLEEIRRSKPHTLSEKEERVVNFLSQHGSSALKSVYDMFTNNFLFVFNGKKVTQEELTTHVRSNKSQIRKKAYATLLNKYEENKLVLNEIYKNVVLDWKARGIDLRKHKSPIGIRSFYQNIDEKTVNLMMEVCRENAHLFQRYFKLKAKLLKVKKLRRYDIYAPLKSVDKSFSYDKAVNMVVDTYSKFDKEMGLLAKSMFDKNMIDSEIRKGKRSGAFCMSYMTDLKPYVLLNYVNKWKDVSTLAHEIGHAIHHMLASKKNTEFTAHAELPVCETASIFGEKLLAEVALKNASKKLKIDILAQQLDSVYATIMRQIYFVIFETLAHEAYKNGATLDEIAKIYYGTLKEQFGDSIDISKDFMWEWLYIPHIFHTPFYCYAYTFGNLLTFALYKKYQVDGKKFVPKIKKILELGGSMNPRDIVLSAGFDIDKKEFWQGGFEVVKEMVDEIELLLK
jgi:oligoendopeptidase F